MLSNGRAVDKLIVMLHMAFRIMHHSIKQYLYIFSMIGVAAPGGGPSATPGREERCKKLQVV